MAPPIIPIWRSLSGGALIGAGVAVLLLGNGQIAGVSGILNRALRGSVGEQGWRILFLAGLLLPALLVGAGPVHWQGSLGLLAVAGVLVGFGTRLGSGCTSGHGVCGLSNLSMRSVAATATFMLVAVLTVAVSRLWQHP
ncbi:MAG: YeeE/YedE family protein [Steroidobacteraceae bacterium]